MAAAERAGCTRSCTWCARPTRCGGLRTQSPSHLQGTLVDTEHLVVRTGRVAAGHVEDLHEVEDETVLVVTSGQLWVDTRDTCTGDFAVACLEPGDAVYVPAGSSLRVLVRSASPATYLWGAGRLTPDDWTP